MQQQRPHGFLCLSRKLTITAHALQAHQVPSSIPSFLVKGSAVERLRKSSSLRPCRAGASPCWLVQTHSLVYYKAVSYILLLLGKGHGLAEKHPLCMHRRWKIQIAVQCIRFMYLLYLLIAWFTAMIGFCCYKLLWGTTTKIQYWRRKALPKMSDFYLGKTMLVGIDAAGPDGERVQLGTNELNKSPPNSSGAHRKWAWEAANCIGDPYKRSNK